MNTLYVKSFKDLSRRKTRTVLTVLTIALGVMGISFFAISPLAERTVDEEIRAENLYDLRIQIDPLLLSDSQLSDLSVIDNIQHVEARTIYHTKMFMGERRNGAIVVGIRDINDQDLDRIIITSGSLPGVGELLTERSNTINGIYSGGEGDGIILMDSEGKEVDLALSGTARSLAHAESSYDSEGSAIFYTGIELVEELSNVTGYNYLSFDLDRTDEASVERTVEDIRIFLLKNTSFQSFSNIPDVRGNGDWPGGDLLDTIVTVLYVLTILAIICSVFLISNTMNTIISEQKGEIAQMKAVGSSRSQIFRSYILTSALMGLAGSVIGVGFGMIVSYLVILYFGNLMGFQPDFMIHHPTGVISFFTGIALAVGSSIPAILRSLRIPTREGMEQKGLPSDYGRGIVDRILLKLQRWMPRMFQMGVRNAGRGKGRSMSTVLQISVAVGVFVGLTSFGYSMGLELSDTIDNLDFDITITTDGDGATSLPADLGYSIAEMAGIEHVEPSLITNFNVQGQDIFAMGYPDDTRIKLHDRTLSEGRWVSGNGLEMVLGQQLSESVDAGIGDVIEVDTASGSFDFTVVGIDTDFYYMGYVAYVELHTLQRILMDTSNVTGFFIICSSGDTEVIDTMSAEVEDLLSEKGYNVKIDVKHVIKERSITQNKGIINTITATSVIIVLISMVGLSSTLAMNIMDRTREIGIMRCIGATSGKIRTVLASEGVFLSVMGWIIGIPLGFLIAKGLSGLILSMIDWEIGIRFPISFVGWSFVAVVLGSLVIAQGPIWRATHLTPEDALRYQ